MKFIHKDNYEEIFLKDEVSSLFNTPSICTCYTSKLNSHPLKDQGKKELKSICVYSWALYLCFQGAKVEIEAIAIVAEIVDA